MNDDLIDRSDDPQLGRSLGLSRRQLLAATTGMAAAAALGAAAFGKGGAAHAATASAARMAPGANGMLIPPGKRGIILYTVRDAISRDPNTTDLPSGFMEVFQELSRIGYKQIEFAGLRPDANAPAATSTTSPARSCCARGSTTTGSRPRATTAASRGRSPTPRSRHSTRSARSRTSSGFGHIGTGSDPTSSAYLADWQARSRSVERLR